MSAYLDSKGDFLREACQLGWVNLTDVAAKWYDVLPERIIKRWLGMVSAPIQIVPEEPRRLLNHFKLGADPEFCFLSPTSGERTNAMDLGFKAAQAWGADNNGRLVEIRPHPSRYALGVLGSIWSTLWWMSKLEPVTLDFVWRAGAWCSNDGLGGHIHFGRKRPTWARELTALDTVAFWFQQANIVNQAEWRERIRRTRGHGNYGQLSDRRVQAHGWEYRTLPSWLDSPWQAYLVLTLSKLAVFDPEFVPPLTEDAPNQTVALTRRRMLGLLQYYKSRDDDAALAHQILLRQGWPQAVQADFKSRWGILNSPLAPKSKSQPAHPDYQVIPPTIPPTPEVLRALGVAMLGGVIPNWPGISPTWKPVELPEGYTQAINFAETYHVPGLGELVRDLVLWVKSPINFKASSGGSLDISTKIVPVRPGSVWLRAQEAKFPALRIATHDSELRYVNHIYLPTREASNREVREQVVAFLTSGWLPCWKISEVTSKSHAEWKAQVAAYKTSAPKPKPLPSRRASRQLYPVVAKEEAPEEVSGEEVSGVSVTSTTTILDPAGQVFIVDSVSAAANSIQARVNRWTAEQLNDAAPNRPDWATPPWLRDPQAEATRATQRALQNTAYGGEAEIPEPEPIEPDFLEPDIDSDY